MKKINSITLAIILIISIIAIPLETLAASMPTTTTITDPLAEDPLAEEPPAEEPPAEDPPTEAPPAEAPPAEEPPAEAPPAEAPPAEVPPVEERIKVAAAPATTQMGISYRTHVQKKGWVDYVSNGEQSGTVGSALRLEAIQIRLDGTEYSGGIEYSTHVQKIGWQPAVSNNTMAGTEGRALRTEAFTVKLTGEVANHYDVYYRVHVAKFGWLGWAKNGEQAGSAGYSYRAEAIEIQLVKKNSNPPTSSALHAFYAAPFSPTYAPDKMHVKYNSHVQNIGWMKDVVDGAASGTTGKALRVEAMGLHLEGNQYSGGLTYSAHAQRKGWMNPVSISANDSSTVIMGTSGQGLRMEAIKIQLTGEVANYYDVYYQVHAQSVGWLDWAKNGEEAGTAGFSYRLEAIKVKLVPKGGKAPGPVTTPFMNKPGWHNINGQKQLFDENGKIVASNAKFIIDVSKWQGAFDWENIWKLNQIDGAIIRASSGRENAFVDTQLKRNVSELNRLKIPYGMYHYANSKTVAEARVEAKKAADAMVAANAKPTYPVYVDIEKHGGEADLVAIAKVFCEEFRSRGYTPAIYANEYYWKSFLNDDSLDKYEKWIAYYGNNNGVPSAKWRPGHEYAMWQYTDKGQISGYNKYIDMNVRF